ncbi:hypothetical protein DN407_30315 (plasmid) [Bacillus sp. JAS24-2]|nr:hypothetical protein DN407_30315 [Bacillus sp. JAS24-2]
MDLYEGIGVPYTTIYTEFQNWINRKLVKETTVGNRTMYEIVDCAMYNHTSSETSRHTDILLSYFQIPFHLIQTTILTSLVKAQDN